MALRRFYLSDLDEPTVQLGEDEARHARKSLRLAEGDRVELFDGGGTVARGTIERLAREMTVRIDERRHDPPPRPRLDLAVAVPKGARADELVESLVQLGADRLVLMRTDRSVVDPRRGKLERLERIAIEAAKQCGRSHLMAVEPTADFDRVIAEADHEVRLMADLPDETANDAADSSRPVQNLHPASAQWEWITRLKSASSLLVLVGPEGGWTGRERETAQKAGFEPWRLGPYVMRIETAAAAAAAIVRHATTST